MDPRAALLLMLASGMSGGCASAPYQSSDAEEGAWPTFGLRGGLAVLQNFDTDLRLESDVFGVGTDVDFEGDLGLDSDAQAFRFDASWRIARPHMIQASFFEIDRESDEFVINEEIRWGDVTFPINASLRGVFRARVVKLAYHYSIVATRDVDVAASLGIHGIGLQVGLEGRVNNVTLGQDFSAPLPMPVAGLHGAWNFAEGFKARMSLEAFYVRLKSTSFFRELDLEGAIFDGIAAVEWNALDPLGIGVGYNLFYLTGNYGDDLLRLRGSYTYDGIFAYAALTF